MRSRMAPLKIVLALLPALCLFGELRTTAGQPPAADITQLWQAPYDLASRDLFFGPWGAAVAPDPRATYGFLRPKKHGTSPGLIVTDSSGRKWHVKQGREGPPEIVMSRILSGIGYHQPPVYFLPSFTLATKSHTRIVAGGRFRLTSSAIKAAGEWSWYENPFVGTKPYQGLLVILALLNSTDLKNVNNAVYEVKAPLGATRWFVVRDLGASLGAIGRLDPKPNDIARFEHHPFITGVDKGFVKFDYGGVHADLLSHSITTDDVRWASRLLGGLSDPQFHDAFRAAGYQPETASRYIRRIRQKLSEALAVH